MAFPIALVAGLAASAIGGALKNRSAKRAAQDQAKLNNSYTAKQDAARNSILEGLKGKGYDIFGPQTTSSRGGGSSSSRSRSTSRRKGTTKLTKTVLAENQAAENMLRGRVEGRLANKAGVEQGEILNQIANINRGSAAAERAVANKVAGRGLGAAGAAGAYTPGAIARTSEINNFLASIPGIARQRQAEDEAAASGFLAERAGSDQDVDETVDTTGSEFGSSSSFGSQTGGPDIGAIQSLYMPTGGPQQSTQTGQSTFGGLLSAGGGALAQYGAMRGSAPSGAAPSYTAGGAWNPSSYLSQIRRPPTFASGTRDFG